MAITAVKLGTSLHSDTDSTTSYTYGSATYSNNKLYLCFVNLSCASATAGPPAVSGITGGGITWVESGSAGGKQYSGTDNTSAVRRVQVFRGLVTSGATTGTLTISIGASPTCTGCHACVVECDGMDTSGTNGSGAIVQTVGNKNDASASTLTVTLSAFGDSNNRPVGFICHRGNTATAPGGTYSELDDGQGSAPSAGSEVLWHATTADTTPNASWNPAVTGCGGIAVEVKALAGVTVAATGVSATSAIGSMLAALTIALTGISATASVGSVTAGLGPPISGVAASGFAGSVSVSVSSQVSISGASGTGASGTAAPGISVSISGLGATVSAGGVGVSLGSSATGVSATGAAGSTAVGISVGTTGVAGTGAAGTVTPSIDSGVTVAATGVSATGSPGSVGVEDTLAVTGLGATGSPGSVSANISVSITGLEATGAAGTVSPVSSSSVSISGASATAGVGTVSVTVVSTGTWDECSVDSTGWQEAVQPAGIVSVDDFFIDVLMEGTPFFSVMAPTYTEMSIAATSFSESSVASTTWTEVSG